jgi:hypothetical protein
MKGYPDGNRVSGVKAQSKLDKTADEKNKKVWV